MSGKQRCERRALLLVAPPSAASASASGCGRVALTPCLPTPSKRRARSASALSPLFSPFFSAPLLSP
eukprot:2003899-Pleurochrysis_carterae.AAC.1